jgi:hypothetical protein
MFLWRESRKRDLRRTRSMFSRPCFGDGLRAVFFNASLSKIPHNVQAAKAKLIESTEGFLRYVC